MTLSAIIRQFKEALSNIYDEEESDNITYLAIESITGLKKIEIALNRAAVVDHLKTSRLLQLLEALKKEEPLQYGLGETTFYGLPFNLNKHVLIPRPETEELVDWIIKDLKKDKRTSTRLLDIGTGSGCIAISLKKNLLNAEVIALDISESALSVAQQNAWLNQVNIKFIQQDILIANCLATEINFDIIVSNPPYVLASEKALMKNNVLDYEPHLALFVNDDQALLYYEAIAKLALEKLNKNGLLYFEINEVKGPAIVEMLSQQGFNAIQLRKDLNGKDRMLKCCRV
jgi:release factor glutamine methyltransferase